MQQRKFFKYCLRNENANMMFCITESLTEKQWFKTKYSVLSYYTQSFN